MRISDSARNLDRDTQYFAGLPSPVRSNETLLEMIYEAHLKPGWLLAPYFQYVWRPSGGIPNPNDPSGISADRRRRGVRRHHHAQILAVHHLEIRAIEG